MKCKIIGDTSFEYEQKWKVILSLQLSQGFQDLTDSGIILRFCSIQSFGVPNETPVTSVIGNRHFQVEHEQTDKFIRVQIQLKKDFTQVVQVQISLDAETRSILTLVYQFLTHQFQATKSRTKSQRGKKSKEVLG